MNEKEVEQTRNNSSEIERDEKGRILPGQRALNPNGRPKGKSLKEFAREWYMNMTDEEKKEYVKKVEEKKPGFAWQMAEGNPSNEMDLKTDNTIRIVSIDE